MGHASGGSTDVVSRYLMGIYSTLLPASILYPHQRAFDCFDGPFWYGVMCVGYACAVGSLSGNAAAAKCVAGKYSTAGSAVCTACVAGQYGVTAGLIAASCSGFCRAGRRYVHSYAHTYAHQQTHYLMLIEYVYRWICSVISVRDTS